MKICTICDKEYKQKLSSQKTCSKECAKEKNKRYASNISVQKKLITYEGKCKLCGDKFFGNNTYKGKVFCSKKCQGSFLRDEGNIDNLISKNQNGYAKNCIICNVSFLGKATNVKTCSENCRKEKDKRRYKKTRQDREENAPVRQCKYCNKNYKRFRERNGFCSRSCASKLYIENGTYNKCQKNIVPSKENTEKRMNTLLSKYGHTNMRKFRSISTRDSKAQKEICSFLSSSLNEHIFYNFAVRTNGKLYFADMYVSSSNTIIEFNGDYWHCNPEKYKEDYFHKDKKKTANEIWEYDKQKEDNIKKSGYNMFVVWESDYKKDKDKTLTEILIKSTKNE